jgi:hypothetical protein
MHPVYFFQIKNSHPVQIKICRAAILRFDYSGQGSSSHGGGRGAIRAERVPYRENRAAYRQKELQRCPLLSYVFPVV